MGQLLGAMREHLSRAHLHEELESALFALLRLDQLQGYGLVGAELSGHLLEFLPGGAIKLRGRTGATSITTLPGRPTMPVLRPRVPPLAALPVPA